jgi:hypothetical protein
VGARGEWEHLYRHVRTLGGQDGQLAAHHLPATDESIQDRFVDYGMQRRWPLAVEDLLTLHSHLDQAFDLVRSLAALSFPIDRASVCLGL